MSDEAEGASQAGQGEDRAGDADGQPETEAGRDGQRDTEVGGGSDGRAENQAGGGDRPTENQVLGADSGTAGSADPRELLSQVKAVRRQARLARQAYWFPLVLFGLQTCASIPFYIRRIPATGVAAFYAGSGSLGFLPSPYFGYGRPIYSGDPAYYWLAALLVGVAATAVWYRWRGDRAGLSTPARGYVSTGVVLLLLALLIPVLAQYLPAGHRSWFALLMPGDLLARGTFPFVIIAIGLCVLAWAERSIALSVIAAGYLALSLVASLYGIENVFYRLGWNLSPAVSGLPNVVLPALVLLLSGAGAWVAQRRHRVRPAEPGSALR